MRSLQNGHAVGNTSDNDNILFGPSRMPYRNSRCTVFQSNRDIRFVLPFSAPLFSPFTIESLTMHFLSALCAVAPFFGAVRALYPQGLITAPNNDTQIAPGESFEFTYNIRSDYCISSYNYTVWLLTSPLSSLMTLSTTGVFLGRFSNPNFPGTVVFIH